MSTTVSSSSSPISVTITPGSTPGAPASFTSISVSDGNLVFLLSDGSQLSLTLSGLVSAIATGLGGASLALLDASGNLLLGGKPRLGVSGTGDLTLPTALPDPSAGAYTPVPGSGVLYSNGGGVSVA